MRAALALQVAMFLGKSFDRFCSARTAGGHHCQGVTRSAVQGMHKYVYDDEIPASVARLPV